MEVENPRTLYRGDGTHLQFRYTNSDTPEVRNKRQTHFSAAASAAILSSGASLF
jgi:hypothetical protein